MAIDGHTEEQSNQILERLSLEMQGNMYNYIFDPSEAVFRVVPLLYKSERQLPTERQVMFALGKIEDIADSYFDKLDTETTYMDFETFELLVQSVVGKEVSGVPILNMLASQGVVQVAESIRW